MSLGAFTSTLGAQTWNLQFSDEFNAAANTPPNPEVWAFDTGNHNGFGNHELEIYCAPGSDTPPCSAGAPNVYQDGAGNLVLRARRSNGVWTSGRIKTQGKKAFQYGRIEARMKWQPGHGFWPAFWMLGNNVETVGWPQSGEQDILEWVQKYGPTMTSSTMHGPGYSGDGGIGAEWTFAKDDRVDDGNYHTYGVVWSKDLIQMYRDNPARPYLTFTPASLPAGAAWVFNQPFFVLLNFAIGTTGFAGPTDATTPSFGVALVDYVRVYQPSATIKEGTWYSVANAGSGACLENTGASTATPAPLAQFACHGTPRSMAWQFTPTDSGYYTVTSRSEPLLWSSKGGPGAGPGEALVQLLPASVKACDEAATNQQWRPVALGDGTFRFVSRDNGSCLNVPGASTTEGVRLQQHLCNGTAAQAFFLTQQP